MEVNRKIVNGRITKSVNGRLVSNHIYSIFEDNFCKDETHRLLISSNPQTEMRLTF